MAQNQERLRLYVPVRQHPETKKEFFYIPEADYTEAGARQNGDRHDLYPGTTRFPVVRIAVLEEPEREEETECPPLTATSSVS